MSDLTIFQLERRVRGLQRRLAMERAAFGMTLLAAGSAAAYPRLFTPGCTLTVDGRPLVAVADRETAQRVLAAVQETSGVRRQASEQAPEVRRQASVRMEGEPPSTDALRLTPDVSLVPPVRLARGNRARVDVVGEEDAVRLLSRAVSVVAPRAAVVVDGKAVAALPTEEDARAALEMVKSHYAALVPELEEEPRFKETVEIKTMPVAAALWRPTPREAAAALRGGAGPGAGAYRVRPGDTASEIAARHHLSLDALRRLNPGTPFHPLGVGRTLRVRPAPPAPLTVLVRRTVRATQVVPFATQKIPSAQMFRGKHLLLQPGRPGKVALTAALIYENGRFARKEVVAREVLVPSRAKVVAVGTRARG